MSFRSTIVLALAVALLLAPAVSAQDGDEASASKVRSDKAPLKDAPLLPPPPFDVTAIFSDVVGHPTASVPGVAGAQFSSFDRPFGSPNGNWILTADTDLATTNDEVLLVNGAVALFEGDPAAWAPGELVGFLDTSVAINDAGDWVFATNTSATTADEYVVKSTAGVLAAVAQEGATIPVLTPPLPAGSTWGTSIDSAVIAADGTVGVSSDTIGGPPTTEDDILVLGTSLLAQEGVTQPSGQLGAEFWENYDIDDFWIDSTGSSWLAMGDLTGDTTTDDVVVVDGAVVVQEGVIIPGSGFANPVDGSGIVGVHMDPGGNWYARGNNDITEQDWVLRNGAVIAKTGDPIFAGAAELWSDVDFSDCFFLHVGNSGGDYVIGGVTDAASDSNGVLVANGIAVVAREGEPIDLDGNGTFDDNANFATFGNDDAFLSDDRILYVVATIQDDLGASIGQGVFTIDLSSLGGGGANIAVDPLSLSSTQPPNVTTQQTLTIGNIGDQDLLWDIYEDGSSPPELVDWLDSFDSYATGSQLHGQGGWKGWFNDPAGGALTSDLQARSAPNSAAIVGASDLVHEYSGSTTGQWVYTAWQYVPSDFAGQSYFILLNSYNDAGTGLNWSVQVTLDGTTDQVTNSGASGGALPLIKGQWVEIRNEIDLDADTQAFYYGNQLLYQGTWTGEMSGGGTANIAAVDLFANGASVIYYDDMSLVEGSVPDVCDLPSDIPWLSASPTTGVVPPAGSTPVQVSFDSTGLVAGSYAANLCVTSNDPDPGPGNGTNLVVVPVSLTVEAGTPAIGLAKTVGTTSGVCATTDAITVPPGTTVYYCYEVTNTGDVTFNVHDLVDDQLGPIFSGLSYVLAPGASVNTVDAGLSISAVINVTTTNTATWTAFETGPRQASAQATDSATVTVEALPPDVGVNPASLFASQLTNTTTTQQMTISNTGGSDLIWELFEEPAGGTAAQFPPPGPVTPVDSNALREAEISGAEDAAPNASGPRDPAVALRARQLLFQVGLLLIPDSTNDRVMAFDPATGDLVDPDFIPSNPVMGTAVHAILSASGDSILVSDQIGDVVHEFDLSGNYLGVFAPAGGPNTAILDNIRGISLDSSGNLLVTVGGGANANAIAQFDTAGNYLGNFVANGAGGLNSPFDVYWRTSATDWIVAGINSDAIHRYDVTGAPIGNLAPIDSFPEQLAEAGNANVLVANFSGTQEGVVEFTSAGALVGIYDPASLGGYRGVYELPNGNILTTNGAGVHEIDRSGNLVATKIGGVSGRFIELVGPQTACTNVSDVPWLSASPTVGTTPPADTTPVDVTFDSTGIAVGIYDATLCLFSNDPDEPIVEVPVQMEVVIPVELMGFSVE